MYTTRNLRITVDTGYEALIARIYSDQEKPGEIVKIGDIVLDRNNAIFPGDAVISVAMRTLWRNDANRPYTPYEEFLTVQDKEYLRDVTVDIRITTTEDTHTVVMQYEAAYTHPIRYERTYSRHCTSHWEDSLIPDRTAHTLPFFINWMDAVMHFLFAAIYRAEYRMEEFGRLRANYINLA